MNLKISDNHKDAVASVVHENAVRVRYWGDGKTVTVYGVDGDPDNFFVYEARHKVKVEEV